MLPKLQTPSSTILVGSTNSGKTHLTLQILNNIDIYDKPIHRVHWYYSDAQAIPDVKLLPPGLDIKYFNKLPTKFVNDRDDQLLVVIDDFMDEAMSSLAVSQLFTQKIHHSRISALVLVQNIFNQGKYSRTISLNSTYYILFRNLRDQQQINKFFQQMCPSNSKSMHDIYIDATKKPHGYLFIDFSQSGHNLLRFRTSLFNNTSCYCPSKALKSSKYNAKESSECDGGEEEEEEDEDSANPEKIEQGEVYALRIKK